jgi:hypothetical protein
MVTARRRIYGRRMERVLAAGRGVLVLIALMGGCGGGGPPPDAALPSCEGLCPPAAFCNAQGVCTCTSGDAGQVQCYRPPH